MVRGEDVVDVVPTGTPEPPLGLCPRPHPVTAPWPEGSRMLIFTDGLVEARDASGTFFPLDESARTLADGDLEQALAHLLVRLHDHAGRRIDDDLALVLVEHRAAWGGARLS